MLLLLLRSAAIFGGAAFMPASTRCGGQRRVLLAVGGGGSAAAAATERRRGLFLFAHVLFKVGFEHAHGGGLAHALVVDAELALVLVVRYVGLQIEKWFYSVSANPQQTQLKGGEVNLN